MCFSPSGCGELRSTAVVGFNHHLVRPNERFPLNLSVETMAVDKAGDGQRM